MKFLYVLALFQLLAGPLVIFQISLLCKLALGQPAGNPAGPAFAGAWNSDAFQATLAESGAPEKDKSSLPSPGSKMKGGDGKSPEFTWRNPISLLPPKAVFLNVGDRSRPWTPVWPQAPPGPPPRVG